MKPSFSDITGRRSLGSMWSFVVALGLFLSINLPAAAATDTLDQSQAFSFPFYWQRNDSMAQTFTAGKTAALDRVTLWSDAAYTGYNNTGYANIVVQIQSVTGATPSTPNGKVQGSTSFKGYLTCCRQPYDFKFDPPVPVTAGTQYAIVVNVFAGDFTWYTSGPFDVYPGGQAFIGCSSCPWSNASGADFAFQTWVTTSVAPTLVISGAPSSTNEGTPILLTGSLSGPAAPTGAAPAAPTYTWSVTKDTAFYTSGSGSTFTFKPDDEGTYVVTLGLAGTTTTQKVTIIVLNVAPTAKITAATGSAPLVLTTQETVNFSGTFSDPGTADWHDVTWDFGDGTPTTTTRIAAGGSPALSTSHSYSAAKTYTVKLTVKDEDGAVGDATAQVTVQTVAQALTSISEAVQNLAGLNEGQKRSLMAKLDAASASAARGDTTPANNQLNAFLNELQADLNDGRISSTEAATLRAAVNAIKAALGTYNRFLSWWPLNA